jgi:sec-independent protein translocase protein TatA
MPFGLGFGETILILFIVLIFFGPRRMPEMGAALGKGIRDFKRALNGISAELHEGANPSTSTIHQPFPAPSETLVATPSQPAVLDAPPAPGVESTAIAPEHPSRVVVDAVTTPVGQVAADHPTLQRSGDPVSPHAADGDASHPA